MSYSPWDCRVRQHRATEKHIWLFGAGILFFLRPFRGHTGMAAGAEGLVKGQSACLHPEFLQGSLSMLAVVVAFVYRYGRLYFSSRARIYFLMSFPASRGHLLPPGHFLHLKSQQGTFGSLTFLPPSYEYPCGYNESNGTSRITCPSPNP